MSLAPIIEHYMSLKRRENTLCSEFGSMTRKTPRLLRLYAAKCGILSRLLALLRDEGNPALARTYLADIEHHRVELAAVSEAIAEIVNKTEETQVKCTYTARPQIVLKFWSRPRGC